MWMLSNGMRCICTAVTCLALSACGLPRGAALMSEITREADVGTADFVVYPVTRTFLPEVENWPLTGEDPSEWLPHSNGSIQRVIRPGDMVHLSIWDASDNSLFSPTGVRQTALNELRVSPTGTIFVPYVGQVDVSRTTPESARNRVERALREIVPSAEVQLGMVEGSMNSVNIVGDVVRPGTVALEHNSVSILDILAEGGGVRNNIENPRVKLQRGGKLYETSVTELYEDPRANSVVRGGDQIIIEEDTRFFLALGASGREQLHPFTKDDISAAEALAISGGVLDNRADPGGVLILREYPASAVASGEGGPEKTRVVFSIDLTTADGLFSARKFRINSEDLVYPTESPINDARTVLSLLGSSFLLLNVLTDL